MDPVTIVSVIVTAICGIEQAILLGQDIYSNYKLYKEAKTQSLSTGTPVLIDFNAPRDSFELSQLLNSLLSRFGRRAESKVDKQMKRDMRKLQPRFKKLMKECKEVEKELASGHITEDVEERKTKISIQAIALQTELKNALGQLIARIGPPAKSTEIAGSLHGRPLKFCHGAMMCQSGLTDPWQLSVGSTSSSSDGWGFVCKFCYLEVADYGAVRFSHSGEAVMYSGMMAASHVIACESFQNRRAYYKCLACFENHENQDFPSALAFEQHMQDHPGYSFIKNESEVFAATKKKIEYYLLAAEPENLSLDDDSSDGNFETTPIGERLHMGIEEVSPENSPRRSAVTPEEVSLEVARYELSTQPSAGALPAFVSPQRPELVTGRYDDHVDLPQLPSRPDPDNSIELPEISIRYELPAETSLAHDISKSAPPSITQHDNNSIADNESMIQNSQASSPEAEIPAEPVPEASQSKFSMKRIRRPFNKNN